MSKLVTISEPGREMVPVICPLKFVQGFRCSRCPWGKLLAECHTPWAVPFCTLRQAALEFDDHECLEPSQILPILQ